MLRTLTRMLLSAVYLLVVTPAGLVSRVVRDPLARQWMAKDPSYWIFTVNHTGGQPTNGVPNHDRKG